LLLLLCWWLVMNIMVNIMMNIMLMPSGCCDLSRSCLTDSHMIPWL
jgi:hypothetical protein